MQWRAECGKPSPAYAALMPIYKLVLALPLDFQKDISVMLAEALQVLYNLEEKDRGKAESGRQNINGEGESPA